jgi:hypothetical protein
VRQLLTNTYSSLTGAKLGCLTTSCKSAKVSSPPERSVENCPIFWTDEIIQASYTQGQSQKYWLLEQKKKDRSDYVLQTVIRTTKHLAHKLESEMIGMKIFTIHLLCQTGGKAQLNLQLTGTESRFRSTSSIWNSQHRSLVELNI